MHEKAGVGFQQRLTAWRFMNTLFRPPPLCLHFGIWTGLQTEGGREGEREGGEGGAPPSKKNALMFTLICTDNQIYCLRAALHASIYLSRSSLCLYASPSENCFTHSHRPPP